MRNNKKKGFTLVELLVVIAILAILATVSVVGYTSFIERADVSVDEQLVAQLNNYLNAYKVNNPADITDKNAHYVIEDIMRDGGLTEIRPQSVKHGYHIYLDLDTDKFVLSKDDEAIAGVSPLSVIIRGFAEENNDYSGSLAPEVVFTKNGLFFVDTHGSDLADVIRGFYEFEDGEFEISDLVALYNKAGSLTTDDGDAIEGIDKIMEKSAFVTNGGVFVLNANAQHNGLFIHKGVTTITNVKKDEDSIVAITPANPLAVIPEGTVVKIPSTVESIVSGALEIRYKGSNEKLDLGVDPSIIVTPEAVSFELATNEIFNKVSGANVAFDVGEFSLQLTNSKITVNGTEMDGYAPVTWSVDDADCVDAERLADGFIELIKAPADGKIVVTATAANGVSKTFEVNVSYITEAEIGIGTNIIDFGSDATMTLVYGVGANEYRLHSNSLEFTYNNTLPEGIVIDNRIKVELPENSPFTYNELSQVLTLDGTKVTADETTITVTLGGYSKEVKIDLRAESEFTFVRATDNIMKVGNKNAVSLDRLFALVGNTFPTGYSLKVVKGENNGYYGTNTAISTDAISGATEGLLALSTATDSITFATPGEYTLYIVDGTGTPVSEEHDIIVLDNYYNVTTYEDLDTYTDKNENAVLLSDIVMTENKYLYLGENAKIYGNNFVFDVTKGKSSNSNSLIRLHANSELDSIMIIGEVYETFQYPGGTTNPSYAGGASIIYAYKDNATIRNCYIANGRSNIRLNTSINLNIENCVLFGGRYANIDVCKGQITLKGDVTTINQLYKNVMGCGIVVDLAYTNGNVVLDNCNLRQYNFLGSKNSNVLPSIKITLSGLTAGVNLSDVFDSLFANPEYDNWKYVNADDSYYNAGITYLHLLQYDEELEGYKTINGNDGSNGDTPNGYEMADYAEIMESVGGAGVAHIYSPVYINNATDISYNGLVNEYNAKLFAEKDEIFNIYDPDNFLPEE